MSGIKTTVKDPKPAVSTEHVEFDGETVTNDTMVQLAVHTIRTLSIAARSIHARWNRYQPAKDWQYSARYVTTRTRGVSHVRLAGDVGICRSLERIVGAIS